MKRKLTHLLTATLLVASSFIFASCGDSESGDRAERTKVRIAYFPNITHTQALIMKNQKTLEEKWKDTCDVSWTSFNAGPAEVEALFAGEIDLGYIGPVPALSANVKSNGEITILSNCTDAGAVLLKRTDAGIETVQDLAEKKIAVSQLGNTQHLCLLSLLADNNLKTIDQGGDITIIASSNADILNLIDNGSVDAAFVPEPWGTTIAASENAEILLDYDEVFMNGKYPTALVVVHEDFLKEHPDLVKEFLAAHEETTLYINEHLDTSLDIVNKEIEDATGKALNNDVIKSAFSRITISSKINKDAIMAFADISRQEGFIDKEVDEEHVFTVQIH